MDILDLPALQWFPGHMKRARDIITENLKLVDVVVEVLDARAPISSQNPMLKEILANKPKIVVLNKSDLADSVAIKAYIENSKQNGVEALALSSISGNAKSLVKLILKIAEPKTRRLNRAARVMVLGIPNVGKSTLINLMAGRTKAKAADTPGITRNKQWVKIAKNLELLDTPGILWPKFDDPKVGLNLAFLGTISDDVYDIEKVSLLLIEKLITISPKTFAERFKLDENDLSSESSINSSIKILECIGKKRGCLIKGGAVDTLKAAKIVLTEFRSGKLGKCSLPEDISSEN